VIVVSVLCLDWESHCSPCWPYGYTQFTYGI
jgi:hypothetical protein